MTINVSDTTIVLDIVLPRLLEPNFQTKLQAARDAMRVTSDYNHLNILKSVFRISDESGEDDGA